MAGAAVVCLPPAAKQEKVQGRVWPEERQSRGRRGEVREEGHVLDVDTKLPPVSQKKAPGQ